jgi:hypothetical protein
MTSEVNDLIAALRDGSLSLEEVAQRFRERSWPSTRPPPATNYLELAEAALQDPEPNIPGSFDDVVAARDRGEITEDQYWTLAQAAAEAIGLKDQRKT